MYAIPFNNAAHLQKFIGILWYLNSQTNDSMYKQYTLQYTYDKN